MHTTEIDLDYFVELSLQLASSAPSLLTFAHGNLVDRIELDPDDPVPSLVGRNVSFDITTVAVCAPATITSDDNASHSSVDQTVVHAIHRSGVAVTILSTTETVRTLGPTTNPQQGRVPDACRRILGLRTVAPEDSMTDFVIAAWLEVIARYAVQTPGLSWPDVVALHPAQSSVGTDATPAEVAEATECLGKSLDWERFRNVIAAVGGFPFGDTAKETAAWMDAGMFSRWAMDLLPSRPEAFDLLEAVLGPSTFDRLWATIRFCE